MSRPPVPLRALLLQMLTSALPQLQTKRRALATDVDADLHADPPQPGEQPPLFALWLASRTFHGPDGAPQLLAPGAQRPMTRNNIRLVLQIIRRCALELLATIWSLHPFRTLFMLAIDIFRGTLPAFRGYSQALIIDEIQSMISTGNFFCSRLCRLVATELLRVVAENILDSIASSNEAIVHNAARFTLEYRQMEQRLRMDVPTHADPLVRDLFHESDLFVRSFSCGGAGAGFGLLSPFDVLRLLTLASELVAHAAVLWSLTRNATNHNSENGSGSGVLVLTLVVAAAPLLLPVLFEAWSGVGSSGSDYAYEDARDPQEARAQAKQETMRALALSDALRPEVVLFGLGPWILGSWAKARRRVLGLDSNKKPGADCGKTEKGRAKASTRVDNVRASLANSLLNGANLGGLSAVIHNLPLVLLLQTSSATLGTFTLYRSSVQALVLSARALVQTSRLAAQGVFLLGAFAAAMEVKPRMQPTKEKAVRYRRGPRGVKVEARNLCYTYPGSHTPALQNVSFTLEPGERLAIVGCNGSGKSTLATLLLRITPPSSGTLLLNNVPAQHYAPPDLHEHAAAVFQGFARFGGQDVRVNVGVGYVPEMRREGAVSAALGMAEAEGVVKGLPSGVRTPLDAGAGLGTGVRGFGDACGWGERRQCGLSGGEWQRIALSRAFMRAHRPEVDLLVLDEPTSSLDAHAQSKIFDTVEQISSTPSGERTKTVVFITHRLATARRADKIAMLEHGTITEFGTHQELLLRNGSYAALYRASV